MVPTQYFANLYDATYDKVLFYVLIKCGKEEVEDILQEIYVEFFRVILKKGVDYIKNPEAFILQLAKSKVYQYYHEKEKQKLCICMEEVERLDFLSKDWEDRLVDCLTAQEVMKYISEKDELTKAIFYQHYFEEKTLKEIAESCGVKVSTVKNRLYRTLRELNGVKKLICIIAILLLAALLAKPVGALAENIISQLKKYSAEEIVEIMLCASFYKRYDELIDNGSVSRDTLRINIRERDYTFEELEEIWTNNPWLEDLNWDNTNSETDTEKEVDYYIN